MKQFLNVFSFSVVAVSLAVVTGCSSTSAGPKDGGGNTTGAAGASGIPLTPDPTGWVDRTVTGTTMIQGAWFAYGDGIGADGTATSGDCVKLGMHQPSECSTITTPTPGMFPNTGGVLCTKGVAAKVISIPGTTMPDYNNIWGAGIGLDLNNSGGDAGVPMPYNATANGVTGIGFTIDKLPLGGMRVEFPTVSTTAAAAFWDGLQMTSPVKVGRNEIRWSAVKGPFYLTTTPPPFDPTTILSLQFHIPSGTAAEAPYEFCVSDVTALTN
jgi:hypothetical protein